MRTETRDKLLVNNRVDGMHANHKKMCIASHHTTNWVVLHS